MQHKLFYSKLRPLVEGHSLLEIIRSSSSGENPHRSAAMELIFERSIQEHRERAVAKVKKLKTEPSPAEPAVRDERSAEIETAVTDERPPTEPAVTDKKPATIKPTPVKSEKKQSPPPKVTTRMEEPTFLEILTRSFQPDHKTPGPAQTMAFPPKERRK